MYGQYPQYLYGNSTYQAPYQRQMNAPQLQYQNQPQAQPQQTFDTPIQDIRYVTREEANAYIVFPNSKALLIDKNSGVAHLKSADNMGQSTSRYFKFEEVNADGSPLKPQEETPKLDMSEYIKKSDLANFGFVTIDQLDKAIQKLTSQQKPQNQSKGQIGSNSAT